MPERKPGSSADWRQALAATILREQADRDAAAKILHDEIGPLLSAAGLRLSLLAADLSPTQPELRDAARKSAQLLDEAIDHCRRVIGLLSPQGPASAGLRYALESIRERFSPQIEVEIDPNVGTITPPQQVGRAMAILAGKVAEYAVRQGARKISISVGRTGLGWALEVLYYESSPTRNNVQFDEPARDALVRLQYESLRFGWPVVIENTSEGASRIRVTGPGDAAVGDEGRGGAPGG